MANTKQAVKRVRQNKVARERNMSQRSEMRTAVKDVLKKIESEAKEVAANSFKKATTLLDRMAGKNLIHPNKAARLKSRINKKLKLAAK